MKKTLMVYCTACFATVCGISEAFATLMVGLVLTGTGNIETRIAGAIGKMVNALMGVQVTDPAWVGRALNGLGNMMAHAPQWVFVCLAVWGLFRALMAIHGRGALRALKEAIKELESSLIRTRRGVTVAKAAVKRQKATAPTTALTTAPTTAPTTK